MREKKIVDKILTTPIPISEACYALCNFCHIFFWFSTLLYGLCIPTSTSWKCYFSHCSKWLSDICYNKKRPVNERICLLKFRYKRFNVDEKQLLYQHLNRQDAEDSRWQNKTKVLKIIVTFSTSPIQNGGISKNCNSSIIKYIKYYIKLDN